MSPGIFPLEAQLVAARAVDRRTAHARRSQAGFTLLELLVALTLLGIVMLAVSSVSFSGTSQIVDETADRHLDATSAQFVSVAFARDVQGAARLNATSCGTAALGTALITLVSSDDGDLVSYRDLVENGSHRLVRSHCSSGGTLLSSKKIASPLPDSPTVSCGPGICDTAGTPPRTVTLQLTRSARFAFAVSGSRRMSDTPIPGVTPAPLFSLGGTTPLSVGGNAKLTVNGNAVVNSSASNAVQVSGNNARLTVTGSFKIRTGGGCSGCNATKVTPFPPGTYNGNLVDPLAYLPAPDETTMSSGSCTANVCTPGIYTSAVSITANTTFQPGVYVLRKGLAISGQANVTGADVVFYNGCGLNAPAGCTVSGNEKPFAISGQGVINLTPPTTGPYAKILLFQSRTNTSGVSITGGAALQTLSGIFYAPASSQVTLGAGGGGLRLGAVVGKNLVASGNGTVQVDGI